MTDIGSAAADRAQDITVARALGWTDLTDDGYTPAGRMLCGTPPQGVTPMWATGRSAVPQYSTDLAAAMTLVEHLTADDEWGDIKMGFSLSYTNVNGWVAAFLPRKGRGIDARGNTPAAAICRAFIAAALLRGAGWSVD